MGRATAVSTQSTPGIATVHHLPWTSSLSLVITNRSAAAHIRRTLSSHLGALFSLHALVMFVLGLWLGYRGAVDEYRACRRAPANHGVAAACPAWAFGD